MKITDDDIRLALSIAYLKSALHSLEMVWDDELIGEDNDKTLVEYGRKIGKMIVKLTEKLKEEN